MSRRHDLRQQPGVVPNTAGCLQSLGYFIGVPIALAVYYGVGALQDLTHGALP
jgi:cytosine/uracil/thiamine/allantoin permease